MFQYTCILSHPVAKHICCDRNRTDSFAKAKEAIGIDLITVFRKMSELLSSCKQRKQPSMILTNATNIPHLANGDNPDSFTTKVFMWTLKCKNNHFGIFASILCKRQCTRTNSRKRTLNNMIEHGQKAREYIFWCKLYIIKFNIITITIIIITIIMVITIIIIL